MKEAAVKIKIKMDLDRVINNLKTRKVIEDQDNQHSKVLQWWI